MILKQHQIALIFLNKGTCGVERAMHNQVWSCAQNGIVEPVCIRVCSRRNRNGVMDAQCLPHCLRAFRCAVFICNTISLITRKPSRATMKPFTSTPGANQPHQQSAFSATPQVPSWWYIIHVVMYWCTDGRLIASAGINDRMVRVWFARDHDFAKFFDENIQVYLCNSIYCPLLSCWLSFSSAGFCVFTASSCYHMVHMATARKKRWKVKLKWCLNEPFSWGLFSSFLKNVLLTSCKDNIGRIWSETSADEPFFFFTTGYFYCCKQMCHAPSSYLFQAISI